MLRREKYPIQKVIPKENTNRKAKKRSLEMTGDKSVKIMRQIIQNEIIQNIIGENHSKFMRESRHPKGILKGHSKHPKEIVRRNM